MNPPPLLSKINIVAGIPGQGSHDLAAKQRDRLGVVLRLECVHQGLLSSVLMDLMPEALETAKRSSLVG